MPFKEEIRHSVAPREEQSFTDEEKNKDTKELSVEPDGGYGWYVVLGGFCAQWVTYGVLLSVMEDYYHQNLFHQENALFELSFVGCLGLVCTLSLAPFVQIMISQFGARPVLVLGSLFCVLSLELASLSHKVWHLYLTQGALFGIGSACTYSASMVIIPQWFTKKRGLALGIATSGSGIGGIIVPFIYTNINRQLGAAWSYRILGFVCLFFCSVCSLCIKENPMRPRKVKKISEIVEWGVLRDVNFLIFVAATMFSLFGYCIPFFFLPAYATSLGMSVSQGSILISVMSIANFIGRFVIGFVADKIGPINTNSIFLFSSSLSCLLVWVFAKTYGALLLFSALIGLLSPSSLVLMSPASASLLGMEKYTSGLSFLFVATAVTFTGPTISSAIQEGTNDTQFVSQKLVSGFTMLIASVLLFVLKFRLNKHVLAKV